MKDLKTALDGKQATYSAHVQWATTMFHIQLS